MKLLVLISVLGLCLTTATRTHRVPLKKVPSVKQRMIMNGKWKEYQARKEQRRLETPEREGYTSSLIDFDDEAYVMNITIGTPGQSFEVLLSLSSGDVWVADASCGADLQECQAFGCDLSQFCNVLCPQSSCCDRTHPPSGSTMCRGKERFNSSLSSTFKATNFAFEIDYPGNGVMSGTIGKDSIIFGTGERGEALRVDRAALAFASIVPDFLEYVPADGIFGLAPYASSVSGFLSPLDMAIDNGLFSPAFTISLQYYPEDVDVRGGLITFGGVDTDNCGTVLLHSPLVSVSSYEYNIQGIYAGDLKFKSLYKTVSETASSSLTLPTSMAEQLIATLGGQYDPTTGLTLIDCRAAIPDLIVQIGLHQLTITAKNLIIPFSNTQCILAIDGADSTGFGPEVVLGEPFMRAYCHIFNLGTSQIGLAPSLQSV